MKTQFALTLLAPAIAFGQINLHDEFESGAQNGSEIAPKLQSLSLEQLCEARSNSDAWAEVERREIFSKRERRAIEKERIRTGIGPDAVSCFMGEPMEMRYLVASNSQADGNTPEFEMYVYPTDAADTLVVFVRRDTDHASVIDWRRTEEWQQYEGIRPIDCMRKLSAPVRLETGRSLQRFWCSSLLGDQAFF
jgi:hypothetical protein